MAFCGQKTSVGAWFEISWLLWILTLCGTFVCSFFGIIRFNESSSMSSLQWFSLWPIVASLSVLVSSSFLLFDSPFAQNSSNPHFLKPSRRKWLVTTAALSGALSLCTLWSAFGWRFLVEIAIEDVLISRSRHQGDDSLPVTPLRALMFSTVLFSMTSAMLTACSCALLLQNSDETQYQTLVVPYEHESQVVTIRKPLTFLQKSYTSIVHIYLLFHVFAALSSALSMVESPFPALSAFLTFPSLSLIVMLLLTLVKTSVVTTTASAFASLMFAFAYAGIWCFIRFIHVNEFRDPDKESKMEECINKSVIGFMAIMVVANFSMSFAAYSKSLELSKDASQRNSVISLDEVPSEEPGP